MGTGALSPSTFCDTSRVPLVRVDILDAGGLKSDVVVSKAVRESHVSSERWPDVGALLGVGTLFNKGGSRWVMHELVRIVSGEKKKKKKNLWFESFSFRLGAIEEVKRCWLCMFVANFYD